MKKTNRRWNIFLMSVGIIFGAYKYIRGGWFCLELGLNCIKAILLSEAMFFVIVSILAGMSNGYGVLVAKAARENEAECKTLIRNGFHIIILLSIGVAMICMLCKKPMIRLLVDWSELYHYTLMCFERWIIIIPFVMLFSYVMVLTRTMGDFKTPCLFVVAAVLLELGMTRILIHVLDNPYGMKSILMAKVCLNILLSLIAYGYFRIKYSSWYRGKVNTRMNWNAWGQFFKAGAITGVLGLPLALMVLVESKCFMETGLYYHGYLLLGALIMAPFMARLLVGKYTDN